MGASADAGEVRLLCWNIGHRIAAWDRVVELAEEHQVDVALLQEAGYPRGAVLDTVTTWPPADDPTAWHTWDRPDSSGRRWCAALVSFPWSRVKIDGEARTPIAEANWDVPTISHAGQFSVGRITTSAGERIALVSLYGIWDTQPGKRWIFADATLHRALSDLTPLMQSGEQVVIAGDLNVLYGYGDLDEWTTRANTVFDRFGTYGVEVVGPFRPDGESLDGCPCEREDCRHVATRPDPSGRPWQIDWVLSNMNPDRFVATVLPIEPGVSDHAPVLVEVRSLTGRD